MVIRAAQGYGEFIVSSTASAINVAPVINNPFPTDEASLSEINITLSVDILDVDLLNVSFFDAKDNSLIDKVSNTNKTTITIEWPELEMDANYSWYVIANDGSLSTTSEIWIFTLTDDPVWIETPVNQEIVVAIPLMYQINAVDSTGIVKYIINDTFHFTIDPTGLIQNNSILGLGGYGLSVTAYDRLNNGITANITITVIEAVSTTTSSGTSNKNGDEIIFSSFNALLPLGATLLIFYYRKKRKKG